MIIYSKKKPRAAGQAIYGEIMLLVEVAPSALNSLSPTIFQYYLTWRMNAQPWHKEDIDRAGTSGIDTCRSGIGVGRSVTWSSGRVLTARIFYLAQAVLADGMQFNSKFVHKEIFKRRTHSSEHSLAYPDICAQRDFSLIPEFWALEKDDVFSRLLQQSYNHDDDFTRYIRTSKYQKKASNVDWSRANIRSSTATAQRRKEIATFT